MARLLIKTATGRMTKQALAKITQAISLDQQIAELTAMSKGIKLELKEGIEAEKLGSIKTEDFTITYKASTARNSIDTKSLKTDNPKLYKKYLKTSSVASSISIKA